MPELPEAETIVRDLQKKVVGRTVIATKVFHDDILCNTTPQKLSRALKQHTIESVTRRAKKIVINFTDDVILVISLGMTGRVVVSKKQTHANLRHIAVRLDLDNGDSLLYDDARRFGSLEIFRAESWTERQQKLGLEPLADEFTAAKLFELARKSITPIRNWLLDQRFVVGIGNIYANEALYRAGIRPTRRARSLTRAETERLRKTIRDVLGEAINSRGSTLKDYRDADGNPGEFASRFQVYDRAGEKCPRCGTAIKRIVLTNRSAFYCPECQS